MNQVKKDREIRLFSEFEIRAVDEEDKEMWVEGYAAVFEEEAVLFESEGRQYKEKISRGAFDGADLSDVIFNYDHKGKVMARTRNKTLQLEVDDKGLRVQARLDGTEEGRRVYEEIRGGYVDRMSFAFKVDDDKYDIENRLRDIKKFKKIYDVCPVSIPAYDSTSISARSFFEAQEEEIKKIELEKRKRIMKLKLMC